MPLGGTVYRKIFLAGLDYWGWGRGSRLLGLKEKALGTQIPEFLQQLIFGGSISWVPVPGVNWPGWFSVSSL